MLVETAPLSCSSEKFGRGEFITLYPQNVQQDRSMWGSLVVVHRLKFYIRVDCCLPDYDPTVC